MDELNAAVAQLKIAMHVQPAVYLFSLLGVLRLLSCGVLYYNRVYILGVYSIITGYILGILYRACMEILQKQMETIVLQQGMQLNKRRSLRLDGRAILKAKQSPQILNPLPKILNHKHHTLSPKQMLKP